MLSIEADIRLLFPSRWIRNVTEGLPTREIDFSPGETGGKEKPPLTNSPSSETKESTLNHRSTLFSLISALKQQRALKGHV